MISDHFNREEIMLVPARIAALPLSGPFVDLALVLALVAATLLSTFVPAIDRSLVGLGLALLLFMFLPGYAMIAALFPGKGDLGAIERIVLSAGMSLVISPLIGFALNFTDLGVRGLSATLSVALFTLVCLDVAVRRRRRAPAAGRFTVDLLAPLKAAWAGLSAADRPRHEQKAAAMVVLSLALVIGAVALVAVPPAQQERYTEFYLYGNNSTMSGYPLDFTLGEPKPVIVGIANHEGSGMAYDLVVILEDRNGTHGHGIYSEHIVLADDQTLEKTINLAPDTAGGHMDLLFLLYADGNQDAPYRACNLWVNVSANA